MVAILQANAFDFGALFDDLAAAFHFQIFNQHHAVAVLQYCAVSIFYDGAFIGIGGGFTFLPFVGAFGACVVLNN